MSVIGSLQKKNLLNLDSHKFASENSVFEGITGSFAYGMSGNASDIDLISICIPPVDMVFPHTTGYIDGFGPRPQNFEVFQKHHIIDTSKQKEYDVTIYSIVKFFNLAYDNNPNIIDILFLPDRCITFQNEIGKLIRQNRHLFLSKKCFYKFIGYAYSQLNKIGSTRKREELVEEFGYDVKFASHTLRLALQAEQILNEHTLDLEKNSEILKSVRRGEWKLEEIQSWFKEKEASLNKLYETSTLRYSPAFNEIKTLLVNCLEMQYGDLSSVYKHEYDGSIHRKYMEIVKIINS